MKTLIPLIIIILFFSNCNSSIEPEELYGEWKYIKVESPRQQPPYIMADEEVKAENPSIRFSEKSDLIIIWGGKQLSNGKFRMEGRMIRYTENLGGGKKREFPFLIKELSKDKLVFETMQQDFTRITAIKVK
jgi:hypothetical protein